MRPSRSIIVASKLVSLVRLAWLRAVFRLFRGTAVGNFTPRVSAWLRGRDPNSGHSARRCRGPRRAVGPLPCTHGPLPSAAEWCLDAALPTTGDGTALEEVGESGRDLAGMGQRQRVIRPGHRDVLGVWQPGHDQVGAADEYGLPRGVGHPRAPLIRGRPWWEGAGEPPARRVGSGLVRRPPYPPEARASGAAWRIGCHLVQAHGVPAQPVKQPAPEQRSSRPQQPPFPRSAVGHEPDAATYPGRNRSTAHRAGRQDHLVAAGRRFALPLSAAVTK